MSKRKFPAALALVGLLILTACGSNGQGQQIGPSNTVVDANDISDAVTLDPQSAYEASTTAADQLMYSTLVRFPYGNLSKPEPDVATSWTVSTDGLTWTFNLKQGITFSSGNTLTADDVVYTFERVVNIPNDPASWLITQTGLTPANVDQDVKAVNPTTVQMTLPTAISQGAWLSIMANSVVGIVDSKVVKSHVQSGDWGAHWLFNNSAGSGPFVLEDWTKNVDMKFLTNPHYNLGPKPQVLHVIWNNTSDTTSRLDQLQHGDADIAEGLTADQVASLSGSSSIKLLKVPEIAMEYLGLDVGNVPAFANPSVREAMKYAVDYNAIINQLLRGNGTPLQGIIPQGIFGYTNSLPYTFDPAKAKTMLAQAGYPNGFTVTLSIPSGTLAGGINSSDLADVIKSDLAQAGVTVNIQQLEESELLSEYRAHKLQMLIEGWYMDYPDPQDFAAPFADYTQKSLIWRLQDNDQALANLAQQASALSDTPQRAALFQQLNQELATGPFVILYQPDAIVAYRNNIHGVTYDNLYGIDYPALSKS